MARITYSAIGITDISGKVGGTTFARNKSGAYIRNYQKRSLAKTPRQTAARNFFSSLATAWRQLTDAEKALWNEFGKSAPVTDAMGEPRPLTGYQAFQKIRTNARIFGAAGQHRVPPEPIEIPAVTHSIAEFFDEDYQALFLSFTQSLRDNEINGVIDVHFQNQGFHYRFESLGYAPSPFFTTLEFISLSNPPDELERLARIPEGQPYTMIVRLYTVTGYAYQPITIEAIKIIE